MIIDFIKGNGGGGEYHLPTATASRLGGVKIGSGITVTNDGTISAEGGSGVYTAEISQFDPSEWTQDDLDTLQDVIDYVVEQGGVPEVRLLAGEYPFYLVRNDSSVLVFMYSGAVLNEYEPLFDAYNSDYVIELHTDDITESVFYELAGDKNPRRFYVDSMDDAEDGGYGDGDILVVSEHCEDAPEEFYDSANQSGYFNALIELSYGNYGPAPAIRLTVTKSEYFDEGSDYGDASFYWEYNGKTYGFGANSDGFYYWDGANSANFDDVTESGITEVGRIIDLPYQGGTGFGGGGGTNELFVYSGSTSIQYGFTIKIKSPEASYFWKGGEWIQVASNDDVNSTRELAQTALNTAYSRVAYTNTSYEKGSDPLQSIQYFETGIVDLSENDPQQGTTEPVGLVIHKSGTDDDKNNRFVTELVSSKTIARIVTLTQTEYDNLGTYDNDTLYAIIPDPNA